MKTKVAENADPAMALEERFRIAVVEGALGEFTLYNSLLLTGTVFTTPVSALERDQRCPWRIVSMVNNKIVDSCSTREDA